MGSVEATVSFQKVGNLPARVAWREDQTFFVPSAIPAHEANCWALIHKCCVCTVLLTLTVDLDMDKCTSNVNRDKLFFLGEWGGGGGGGNVVLNEWYLMFQSGMAWSRSLENYATRG